MRIRHSLAILLLVLVVPGSPCFAVDDPVKPPGLTYLVAVDISGSMNDPLPAPVQADLTRTSKLEDVRGRLALLAQYLPAQTRVIVTTFDHSRQLVCDLTLGSAEDRRRLEKAFASIKSQNGSTFLWRTADDQLRKAEQIAKENPESRVRVLLYTDGDDMEKAPGMDHESLIRKYGNSLQSVVELDWVTLGYDLKPKIKSALSDSGVRFTEAKSLSDLVPLRAGFRSSATDVKYGEFISLMDSSLGLEIIGYTVSWGDGSADSTAHPMRHVYKKPGTFVIRYTVQTQNGQTSTAEESVTVRMPNAPLARIRRSAETMMLGESIELVDETESAAEIESREWSSNGVVLSKARSFQLTPDDDGNVTILLKVRDAAGQTDSTSCVVQVMKPPAPVAKIRLSQTTVKPGEEVTAFEICESTIVSREWKVDGMTRESREASFHFSKPGDHSILLTVKDAFGQSSSAKATVSVVLPPPPKAAIRLSSAMARPGDLVTCLNESLTTAVHSEWNIGGRIFHEPHVTWCVETWGDVEVQLTVSDQYGQQSKASAVLSVPRPPQPSAEFVGPITGFIGDTLTFVDQSAGLVDGPGEWKVNEQASGSGTILTLKPDKSGILRIERIVSGPGGESSVCKELTVQTRSVEPRARLVVDRMTGYGRTTIQFRNESSGTIRQALFDPGDGSAARLVTESAVFSHTYEPGTWTPSLVVSGAEELPTSRWYMEQPLQISQPLPEWIWNLMWQVPATIVLCVIGLTVVSFAKSAVVRKRQLLLSGELTVRDPSRPLQCQQFYFEGLNSEATVALEGERVLKLRSQPADGEIRYQVQLFQQDEEVDRAELEDSVDQSVGPLVLRYMS